MRRLAVVPLLLMFVIALPAAARDDHDEESGTRALMSLPAEAVVDGDYFAYGERVEISGTVNGDVYAAGGQVLVDGTINGDLLAAGGSVTVSGTVSQDARLAGGQVAINGTIGRSLTIAGGNVEVNDSAAVKRALIAAGGRVRVSAPVGADAKLAAGSVTVSNRVAGNLHAASGDLRLTSKAAIGGNLTYWSQADASIDQGAQVTGMVTRKAMPEYRGPTPGTLLGALAGLLVLAKLVSLASTLVLGLLFLYLLPRYTQSTVSTLRERPWASLGVGLIALVLTPIAAGMLLITVLGAPLGLMVMMLYLVAVYLARVFVIIWVGTGLFGLLGKEVRPLWAFVAGLILYAVATIVPFLGGFIALTAVLFGLGAALLADRSSLAAGGGRTA